MQRLEIYRHPQGSADTSYLIFLQSDGLNDFATVVFAPLTTRSCPWLPSLNPPIEIAGQDYFIALERLAAIETHQSGERIQRATELDKIGLGLDLLFFGV